MNILGQTKGGRTRPLATLTPCGYLKRREKQKMRFFSLKISWGERSEGQSPLAGLGRHGTFNVRCRLQHQGAQPRAARVDDGK